MKFLRSKGGLNVRTTEVLSPCLQVLVVVKVLWGDPREKLCQAINEIPMSCLVIGSRGLGKLKRLAPSCSQIVVVSMLSLLRAALIF